MKAEFDAQECQFLITGTSLYLQALAARTNQQLAEAAKPVQAAEPPNPNGPVPPKPRQVGNSGKQPEQR